MKKNSHFEQQATGEIYHNQVRDFFEFPIVKRALGMLWNEHHEWPNAEYTIKTSRILENYADFTLEKPAHFTFIRSVFEDDENVKIFFQNLRESAIESGSIADISENYMSITQMILSMQYLIDAVEGPYGMKSLLDERIKTIVEENSNRTFQSLEDPEETTIELGDCERFLNLTIPGFSPISQYGDLVRSDEAARPYHIVHDAIVYGENQSENKSICIDKTGKVYEGIERLQAFITQNRCVIENIENIERTVESGKADIEYIKQLRYTYDMQGTFPEEDDPDFTPAILEELSLILVDAKIQLKYFCEELGKTMSPVGDDTEEYDPLKPRILADKERDFPTVGARIKGVK